MLLLSFDTLRVAASEQLRWYASILGVAFHVVDTGRGLVQALDEHRNKGLIFIDTAGFSLQELAGGCETAEILASRDDIQTHLVLPASMRSADMTRTLASYRAFRPARLVFTRIDETETVGPLLSMAAECPVSFLGTGQRVPEDLLEGKEFAIESRLLPSVELACGALSAA
jgi:flagellar biosynthesis protein FlhF